MEKHNLISDFPPPFMFGMVIGYADAIYDQIPNFIKAVMVLILALTSFYDLKADIKVIQTKITHAESERKVLQEYLFSSKQCLRTDCNTLSDRITNLEREHINGNRNK